MSTGKADRRWLWMLTGLVAGLGLATIWPHEPLTADTADRNEKFAMITVPISLELEGVFVLDFLTGRLTGAAMNRTRQGTGFVNFYYRNLAEDFNMSATGEPYYAVASGQADIQNRGGTQWGTHALYVGEMTSGKVAAYAIPFRITQAPAPPEPLVPMDGFRFREQTVTQ